jgi:hypothetical protein
MKNYKIAYSEMWESRYTDFKKFDKLKDLARMVKEEIDNILPHLNKGYYLYAATAGKCAYTTILSKFQIDCYNTEIEYLTELLNRLEIPEHEVFNANLNGKNMLCEWDKIYKYVFIKRGAESTNNVVVRKFDDWGNHMLNTRSVMPFVIDNHFNVVIYKGVKQHD